MGGGGEEEEKGLEERDNEEVNNMMSFFLCAYDRHMMTMRGGGAFYNLQRLYTQPLWAVFASYGSTHDVGCWSERLGGDSTGNRRH